MKSSTLILLIFFSVPSMAQKATLLFHDGSTAEVEIAAHSKSQLFTKGKTYNYTDFHAIYFDEELKNKDLYADLNAAQIAIYYIGTLQNAPDNTQPATDTSRVIVKENSIFVNDVDINVLDIEFVQIVGTQQLFSQKSTVTVAYGQKVDWGSDQRIRGIDGKVQKFYGMIDALNFMYQRGWDFETAYAITVGNQNVYHYLLRRKH